MPSLLGKYVELKDNGEHSYEGHYGWVVAESQKDDEYTVEGGSISTLGGGLAPVFCRRDFIVPRRQPNNREVWDYIRSLDKE